LRVAASCVVRPNAFSRLPVRRTMSPEKPAPPFDIILHLNRAARCDFRAHAWLIGHCFVSCY
jgi:hypothetical protein